LALQKMEKAFFVGSNKNRPLWYSSPSQGTHTCPIWPRSHKLCHGHDRIWLISHKSHATSNVVGHFCEETFW
jgi:hypothetical protein